MHERSLITWGGAGGVFAAICCVTPLVAITLGALGLSAWLGWADYVLIPLLALCLAMLGIGLYRRRARAR